MHPPWCLAAGRAADPHVAAVRLHGLENRMHPVPHRRGVARRAPRQPPKARQRPHLHPSVPRVLHDGLRERYVQ
jgi:hypothetical protein